MTETFNAHTLHHGDDTEVSLGGFVPELEVWGPQSLLRIRPDRASRDLTTGDFNFARQLSRVTDQYADQLAYLVGDAQAGADFWASIDTCPDDCRHQASGR